MEPNSKQSQTVVLHTILGAGHLAPMVELAKLFLGRGFAVIIAVPTPPASTADVAASSAPAVARIAAANPSISFHNLPPPDYPEPDPDGFQQLLDVIRLTVPILLTFLRSLPPVAAVVLDLFCVDALDAAAAVGVPAYFYFTSSAGVLAAFLHLPHYFATTEGDLKDMGKALLHFPGVPPIPASDMPHNVLDCADVIGASLVYHYRRMPEARGMLINTYEWLEAKAVTALGDGACVPDRPTPPVYCIGPLIVKGEDAAKGERHACLAWLDAQPERSVVFVSFGSMGAVSAEQLKEIARGLENSGHRFLWVVRSPPPEDPAKFSLPRSEPDLGALLPEKFLERTRERGMVVMSWAPQVEVLRHAATAAFVTHCGWNSILEAATAGVPMLCWPQYAEQRLNKVLVVDGMQLGVVMDGYDEELVKAEEVEKKVRLVMDSDEGKKLRGRLAMAKEMAAEALADGGPSCTAFSDFVDDLQRCK
ncbi:UDP-glycosyltransferase 88F3 [Oryza sativa Japonica Group]|uniref:Glycosyltransferase n=3 Tax=Oryza sativa subsp. japonica TaxID=39947 RepID=A0A5S6R7Z7_ORYSJ|nr:UDP-glycosyltransferase 88F3 [Oryza sativa Japonica Group]KAB8100283.1 hypothetical protein EE612_030748 [Oryza sativa]EEE64432.1 hypothetical protein OsJ_19277 [Oryza sativa Japonica Group]KAF2931747.1 hypothetical protein DAI22_05g234100 [Oryza sativa Japonica Group]BAF18020.2 Os05g0526900 [Oryza sativa Japonica Group]BAS94995.1 Os05g0526900 [Oryza sativa Japonica Group]|eukprot:NP_001056106.2 Os05g0526900 [Oryza sativa Japonica Group]